MLLGSSYIDHLRDRVLSLSFFFNIRMCIKYRAYHSLLIVAPRIVLLEMPIQSYRIVTLAATKVN